MHYVLSLFVAAHICCLSNQRATCHCRTYMYIVKTLYSFASGSWILWLDTVACVHWYCQVAHFFLRCNCCVPVKRLFSSHPLLHSSPSPPFPLLVSPHSVQENASLTTELYSLEEQTIPAGYCRTYTQGKECRKKLQGRGVAMQNCL